MLLDTYLYIVKWHVCVTFGILISRSYYTHSWLLRWCLISCMSSFWSWFSLCLEVLAHLLSLCLPAGCRSSSGSTSLAGLKHVAHWCHDIGHSCWLHDCFQRAALFPNFLQNLWQLLRALLLPGPAFSMASQQRRNQPRAAGTLLWYMKSGLLP